MVSKLTNCAVSCLGCQSTMAPWQGWWNTPFSQVIGIFLFLSGFDFVCQPKYGGGVDEPSFKSCWSKSKSPFTRGKSRAEKDTFTRGFWFRGVLKFIAMRSVPSIIDNTSSAYLIEASVHIKHWAKAMFILVYWSSGLIISNSERDSFGQMLTLGHCIGSSCMHIWWCRGVSKKKTNTNTQIQLHK